jgi:Fe-S oxidoreductase
VNVVLSSRLLHPLLSFAGGVDRRRGLPRFAPVTFRRWFADRAAPTAGAAAAAPAGDVVLFVDTFTDSFSPEVGRAAVAVLEHAGYRVRLTSEPVCCGLTWISTGQLDGARRRVRGTVRALLPHVQAGAQVVGLEPSCTAVLRSDALELLDGDELAAAEQVAAATKTLAELLSATPGWRAPDLTGTQVVAQPHCHHHAVMGWSTDAALLASAGAHVQRLGGCCGLAGNFGVERGHYDVSVKVAENQLLPAVRDASDEAVILADGFSCRTQLDDLSQRSGVHLAQLLADHLPS